MFEIVYAELVDHFQDRQLLDTALQKIGISVQQHDMGNADFDLIDSRTTDPYLYSDIFTQINKWLSQ